MEASSLPRRLPLTGADCFLRAFDWQTRRYTGASHLAHVVLRLGPGFDRDHFETVWHEIARACRIVRAPVRRPLLGAPVYRLDLAEAAPMPAIHDHPATAARDDHGTPRIFFDRLNERFAIRRGELLSADIVPRADGSGGTDIGLTWAHMLMDGAGCENFVAHLSAVAAGERHPQALPPDEWRPDAGLTAATAGESFRQRGDRAMAWQSHLQSFEALPPRSPAGPLRRVPQQLDYAADTLSIEETKQVLENAKQYAGFLTPMLFHLAVTIRAHAAVMRARGAEPESYIVPLPVNGRPKGAEGALFRTRVSMLWFQVTPEDAATLPGLIAELKKQRHAMIKSGAVENGLVAMDMARYAPAPVYARMARRGFGGELCSFFFAYTAEFAPGVDELCGAPIENAHHSPSVPASPGSGVFVSLRGDRLNVVHVRQRDAFSDEERTLLADAMRRGLLTPDAPG